MAHEVAFNLLLLAHVVAKVLLMTGLGFGIAFAIAFERFHSRAIAAPTELRMIIAMARRFVTCSWCHELCQVIAGRKTFCWSCGHRADIPRTVCDCRKCRQSAARTTKVVAA